MRKERKGRVRNLVLLVCHYYLPMTEAKFAGDMHLAEWEQLLSWKQLDAFNYFQSPV